MGQRGASLSKEGWVGQRECQLIYRGVGGVKGVSGP